MTDSREQHWQEVYSTKDEAEVSWFQDRPQTSLGLIAQTGLSPDASLIDIGGGASRLVDALLAAGWRDIAVLDIAGAALAKARARLGPQGAGVDWIVADITAWQPRRRYDLWHDRAVFHFLASPGDRAAYKAALRSAIAPGGHVVIGSFALDGPERCSGLPVQRYSPETLSAELGPDYVLEQALQEDHHTPAGRVQHFQFSRFRRV
ncbi:trans-aconitate 2-methyltransferase [Ferrovibrio sp.]|uniref:class I SAM-dependent methyltransferase n=1 Tax=Ferrovibrio sp. TaxID=1917215 RepID=UPI0035AF0C37